MTNEQTAENRAIEYTVRNPIGELGYISPLRFHYVSGWTPEFDDMIEVYMDDESLLCNWIEANEIEDYTEMNMDQWLTYYESMADYIDCHIGEELRACEHIGDVEHIASIYPFSVEYALQNINFPCRREEVLALVNPYTSIWKMENV